MLLPAFSSHLSELLASLGAGNELPAPGAMRVGAPAPIAGTPGLTAAPRPAQAPPRLSLVDRLRVNTSRAAHAIPGAVLPIPPGFEGLLSPDAIKHARSQGLLDIGLSLLDSSRPTTGPAPSLGASLAQALHAGRESMTGSLTNSVNMGLLADDETRKHALLTSRAAIQQQYGPKPGATDADIEQSIKKMFAAFAANGDVDMTARLAQVLPSLERQSTQRPLEHIDLGDVVSLLDPTSGKVLGSLKKGIAPKTPAEVDAGTKFQAEQTNKILDDFRASTHDYDAAKAGYEVLKGAIEHPGIAQPFAVLDAYARVINPGAVVRQGTMAVLQEMGAYDDKIRRWLSMAQKGQWPDDMLESIKGTIDAIMTQHGRSYEEVRGRAIERARRVGIKDIDGLMGKAEQITPAKKGNAAEKPATGYSPKNPFAKSGTGR